MYEYMIYTIKYATMVYLDVFQSTGKTFQAAFISFYELCKSLFQTNIPSLQPSTRDKEVLK